MITTTTAPTAGLPHGGRTRLLHAALLQDGPQTLAELSACTGVKRGSVRGILAARPDLFCQVLSLGTGRGNAALWGLAGQHAPQEAPTPVEILAARSPHASAARPEHLASRDARSGKPARPARSRLTRAQLEARCTDLQYSRIALAQLVGAVEDYLAGHADSGDLELVLAAARGALADTAPAPSVPATGRAA